MSRMANGRIFGMNRQDRRWVALAAGLLALWLQVLAPFVLVSGMQIGMSQQAAAADAIDYLCQPIGLDHGKAGGSGKHLLRLDCQVCQSLHLLAQGLTPGIEPFALPDLPAARPLLIAHAEAGTSSRHSGFSSRAPPSSHSTQA
jgi:hypothetical protein